MLHVSLDVDFPEPYFAPAVGTTVPGGATFRKAHLVMEMTCDSGLVTSLDMVEPNLFPDDRGRSAKLMVDLCASLPGRKVIDRPRRSYWVKILDFAVLVRVHAVNSICRTGHPRSIHGAPPMTNLFRSKLAMVPFVSIDDMIKVVKTIGPANMMGETADYIEADFLRWELFERSPQRRSPFRRGRNRVDATSDDKTYGFK